MSKNYFRLGVIGSGNHFKKKIKKSLKVFTNIKLVDYLNCTSKKKRDRFYKNNLDFVYISSPSMSHQSHIIESLKANCHVICEKPFVSSFKNIKKIIQLSKSKNKLIFEVFAYKFHPAFIFIKKIMKKKRSYKIISSFTFPSLIKKNNRYKNNIGGGFFWDAAVYPLSLNIFLKKMESFKIKKIHINKKNVPLNGNFKLQYKNNDICYSWGEGLDYENFLKIITKKELITLKKIYTQYENEKIIVEISRRNNKKQYIFKIKSSFILMFQDIFKKFKIAAYQKENRRYIVENWKIRKKFAKYF